MKKSVFTIVSIICILTFSCIGYSQELHNPTGVVKDPDKALLLLKEGNKRFVADRSIVKPFQHDRNELVVGQHPFAVVVCCSDSRVVPEIIFNQKLGDLFVIRVAGNVLGPIELGSIEYAVDHLHSPLVVILGHESCGAVTAIVEQLISDMEDKGHSHALPRNIESIAEMIRPSLSSVLEHRHFNKGTSAVELLKKDKIDILEGTCDQNVEKMVSIVRNDLVIKANHPKVIGGKYLLKTGKVDWFNQAQIISK